MFFRRFIFLINLIVLSIPSVAFGQERQTCLDSIEKIFKQNPDKKEALQKFLQLQASLSMHKIAYALFRKDISKERFQIENEIMNILQNIEKNKKNDSDFRKVYEMYHHPQNKLSRHALAEVLPHIQDILNDQINQTDPFKRQYLMLDQADITMLAILAEKEKKYDNGSYAQILSSNRQSDSSVLNIVKIINSSIRNTNDSADNIRETILEKINLLTKQIEDFIKTLGVGRECDILILNCNNQRDDAITGVDPIFIDSLLKTINVLDIEDKHKYLRYSDVWLKTKGTVGGALKQKSQSKSQVKHHYEIITEDPQNDEQIVLEYLVNHVLKYIPNFFSKNDLLSDPELTYALARAIDEGALSGKDPEKRAFFYKGKAYSLPETWNTSYSSQFLISASQYGRKANEWIFRNFQMDNEKIPIPPHIPKDEHEEFLNIRNEQKQKFGHNFTFVYNRELYDIKTGEKIPRKKEAIFLYPLNGISESSSVESLKEKSYPQLSLENLKIMADEIRKNQRSFILNGVAYHISGAQVKPQLEYKRAKATFESTNINLSESKSADFPSEERMLNFISSDPNRSPAVLKALADKNRAISYEDEVIDLYTMQPLGKEGAIRVIVNHKNKFGLNKKPEDFSSFDKNYLQSNAQSILNHRPTFYVNNKEYHSDNGRVVRSAVPTGSVYQGYINHDYLNDQRIKVNSGSDLHIISTYHQKYGLPSNCESYTIIDKKNAKLLVLDQSKAVMFESEILLGAQTGDQRTRYRNYSTGVTNNRTGAGVFSMQLHDSKGLHINKEDFELTPIYLNYTKADGTQDLSNLAISGISKYYTDRNTLFNNGNLSDNRVTNGSIVLPNDKMKHFESFKKQGCPLYVLPESDNVKFKIVENNLLLTTQNVSREIAGDFQLSAAPEIKAKKIKITITDDRYNNELTKKFMQTLQLKKEELLNELKLTNDEYNELVKLAFGIIGTESGFGSESMFKIKEARVFGMQVGQWLVDEMKGHTITIGPSGTPVPITMLIGDNANSRGHGQVKNVRSFLKDKYPHIQGSNLNEPENTAIAIMFVLASKLQTLKKLEGNHTAIDESNRMDYLYYLYMGSADEIKKGVATPELNLKAKEVMGYSEKVSILTEP